MPPKVKVTREQILEAAVETVRQQGDQALNARTLAAALNCSTQPIFSNFATMEQLRQAVLERADALYQACTAAEMNAGQYPAYKASGMAYIRFAKEEKELFKLLFMRDRAGEPVPDDMEYNKQIYALVHRNTGLEGQDVQLFHLEMWAAVHGIAAMFATGYLDLAWEVVSRMLTDLYLGLRKQYERT